MSVTVHKSNVRSFEGCCRIQARVDDSARGEYALWFDVPLELTDHVNRDFMDPFLVALLPHAMATGQALRLDGDVSERLLYHVRNHLVPLLACMSQRFRRVEVAAKEARRTPRHGQRLAATGFSGGIDSFCTVAEHVTPRHDGAISSYRLGALLFNNVGAVPYDLFFSKHAQLSRIEELIGLKLVPISSNLGLLINNIPFQLAHGLRNAACALILDGLYDKVFCSSAYPYGETFVGETVSIAYADPIILPLLSTESLEFICSGAQYTRVEKTGIVADFEPSYELLNVCAAANRIDNCSACWKCGRTLLTLELLGVIDKYRDVFDLAKWRQVRDAYIAEYVLNPKKSSDSLNREVLQLARQRNVKFGLSVQAMGALAGVIPEQLFRKLMRTA